jgi:hypothetical protein
MPDLEKSFDNEATRNYINTSVRCIWINPWRAWIILPSNMISQNYSHDSKVWTKEYNLDGNLVKETGEKTKRANTYTTIFLITSISTPSLICFAGSAKSEKSKREKVKIGVKVCRWAQLPDNKRSILPAILEELLKARSETRKQIKR